MLDLHDTGCHWHPSTRLLADLALLGLLPSWPGHLVSGHEGTGLGNRHQVVGRDHVGIGGANESTGHALGSNSVLGG